MEVEVERGRDDVWESLYCEVVAETATLWKERRE